MIDRSTHPPSVSDLQYRFSGWLGDVLLESFPVFIISEEAAATLAREGLSGAAFEDVQVIVTQEFRERHTGPPLPRFVRLKPPATVGDTDFALAGDGRLVVSRKALRILTSLGIAHALCTPV